MRHKNDNTLARGRKSESKGSKKAVSGMSKATPLSTNKTGQTVSAGADLDVDQVARRRRRPQLLQDRGRVQDFGNF